MADINLGVGGANSAVIAGYDIDNSLKLEPVLVEMIYRPSGLGTSVTSTKGTISYWHKTTELGSGTTWHWVDGTQTQNHYASLDGNDVFYIAGRNESFYKLLTTRKFRDTSAWYHFVIAYDTTQATASDRIKLYVNGVQETDFTTANYPAQNIDLRFLTVNGQTYFGNSSASSTRAGYYAEMYFLDGQTLAPTDFGEFDSATGIWKPKEFTGSFGSNDYYLDFKSSGSLGADASGNSNNFSLQNVTSADQATDTPTNNFCTLTSVANFYWEPKTENAINGGTSVADSNVTNNWTGTMATTPLFTGKWYWEVRMNQPSEQMCGIHDFTGNVGSTSSTPHPYQIGHSWVVYGGGAYWIKSIDGTSTTGGSEGAFSNGTIVGVALDLDNHLLTFYENGGSAGTNLTNIDISSVTNVYSGPWMPFVGVFRNSLKTNFGGFSGFTIASGNTDENGYGNFEYAPPSGFLAICSKNLAES